MPVLLLPFILKSMPESLAYLLKEQNQQDLKRVVTEMDPSLKMDSEVVLTQMTPVNNTRTPVAQLFQEGRALSTLMFWGAYFTGLFMVYALSTWLTKLMAMSGLYPRFCTQFCDRIKRGGSHWCCGRWLASG